MRQTSHNTKFPQGRSPLGPPRAKGFHCGANSEVQGSVGRQPCEPNRAAAGPSALRFLGSGIHKRYLKAGTNILYGGGCNDAN